MMEQLAERRMQREEEASFTHQPNPNMHRQYNAHDHPSQQDEYDDDEEVDDEDGYEDDDYEEDDEEEEVRIISGVFL